MPKQAKRCDWFDFCPLRTVLEIRGDETKIKKFCKGKFMECARYKMQEYDGRLVTVNAGKKAR